MRKLLSYALILLGFAACNGQVSNSIDLEYVDLCLVDSLPSGERVQFTRIIQVATQVSLDIDATGASYTPVGTLLPCEDPEYFTICLTDSLANGSLIRFNRVWNWGDSTFTDYDETYTASYSPTGSIISCREADNLEIDTFQVAIVEPVCQVLNIPAMEDITGATAIPGNTYHSVSITILEGTVNLTIGAGATINLPAGYTATWTAADDCELLDSTFTINTLGLGRAIVSTLR